MVIFLSSVHGFLNLNSRERIIRNYIGLLIYTGYKLFYRQMIFNVFRYSKAIICR
jgi:hypothetical protein